MAADTGSSSLQLPCVFSPNSRQYLALCAQDGRLRIWNTDSKTLHQEYVPSAHLSATCICIAWAPCRAVKVRDAARARPEQSGEFPQRKARQSVTFPSKERTRTASTRLTCITARALTCKTPARGLNKLATLAASSLAYTSCAGRTCWSRVVVERTRDTVFMQPLSADRLHGSRAAYTWIRAMRSDINLGRSRCDFKVVI